jgi:hypothetical protein
VLMHRSSKAVDIVVAKFISSSVSHCPTGLPFQLG